MKKSNYQKIVKSSILGIALLAFGAINAQQTTGDVTQEANIIPGSTTTGGSVRVIDNKGTIKYLQSKNGITMLSNTTNDITTTTWQLGGALTDDTYIDVAGNVFAIDGIALETGLASTDATDLSTSTTATGTGFTVLVRDEATGETKKLLATDLLQSGQESFTAALGQTAYALTGAPVLPTFSQVWVYRNGAKLIANVDYTVTRDTVTLVPSATPPNDWAIYANDMIEIQFVK